MDRRWRVLVSADGHRWFAWPHPDLQAGTLRTDEAPLHHWPAPAGLGVLTNLRILLASHPHPIHRMVVWQRDLEAIGSFAVQATPEEFAQRLYAPPRPGFQSAAPGPFLEKLPETYAVVVDEQVVFVGHPDHCSDIQAWIDAQWVSRRESLGWPQRPPLGPPRTVPDTSV